MGFLKCQKYKVVSQLESQAQSDFIRYARFVLKDRQHLIFAIPNGGSRNIIEASNLKKQGVVAGVPDLFLAIPNKDYHGLFIEMKRETKSKVSDNQKEVIALLKSQGYAVEICYGFQEAVDCFNNYLAK
jgi:hypothetical protein